MFRHKRIVFSLLATAATAAATVAAAGCSGDPGTGTAEGESRGSANGVSATPPAPGPPPVSALVSLLPIVEEEYRLPAVLDKDVAPQETEVWAQIYRPATLASNTRYPLLVFMHGNHGVCGMPGTSPREDNHDNVQTYVMDGVCPPPYKVVNSHLGYKYLADYHAARGYIVVSLNMNRGLQLNPTQVMPEYDPSWIRGRAKMLLKHLALLSECDKAPAGQLQPAAVCTGLKDHLDFSQVGLMGHSRGGEAVRVAYNLYRDGSSPWVAKIKKKVTFQGILEIAPTDAYGTYDAYGTRWAVILPTCDGDVHDHQGMRPFDRMQASRSESPPGFKATLAVWGANHNYFNTQWEQPDASPKRCGETNQVQLFPPGGNGSGITGSPVQWGVGLAIGSAFFGGNVGTSRDPSLNNLFNTKVVLAGSIIGVARVDRGFLLSPDPAVTTPLEDFSKAPGTSMLGVPNTTKNVVVDHLRGGFMPVMSEHDPGLYGAHVGLADVNASKFFQINFAAAGSGIPLTGYETLDLRTSRVEGTDPSEFDVQLVSDTGALSAPTAISSVANLKDNPLSPGGKDWPHYVLQTARIPMTSFTGISLDKIRGVRFTFSASARGAILLANLRVTKNGAGASLIAEREDTWLSGPGAPPASLAVPHASAGALASSKAAGLARIPMTPEPGRVVAWRALRQAIPTATVPATEAIEITSPNAFPITDDDITLRIGDVLLTDGYFPDMSNLRRVAFPVTAEQRRLIRGGEPTVASAGRTMWDLGKLSPSLLK